MKNLLLSIWLFSLPLCAYGQQGNDMHKLGDRVMVHTDSTVAQAQVMSTGKKQRIWGSTMYHWYAANRIHNTRGGFSGKLLHGIYSEFSYPDKYLIERGEFKKGVKNGKWKTWFPNGEIKHEASWKNGKLEGGFEEYNSNGALIRKGHYRNDKLNGEITTYFGADSIQTTHYRNGRQIIRSRRVGILLKKIGKRLSHIRIRKKHSSKDNHESKSPETSQP